MSPEAYSPTVLSRSSAAQKTGNCCTPAMTLTQFFLLAVRCSMASPHNFTSYNATFTSLNYPSNYDHKLDCRWLIIASSPYTVSCGKLLAVTDYQMITLKFSIFRMNRSFSKINKTIFNCRLVYTVYTLTNFIGGSN